MTGYDPPPPSLYLDMHDRRDNVEFNRHISTHVNSKDSALVRVVFSSTVHHYPALTNAVQYGLHMSKH